MYHREAPPMCYRFPYIGTDLRQLVHQPGIQWTLQDHGYGLVYHVVCLFTPSNPKTIIRPGTNQA